MENKILDNPQEFFKNIANEEFDELLEELELEYENNNE